ncbi:MAG: Ig-like domain-containing protein [Luteolibacter sp.]|uniref:Ig-like domain-containing protein n=1 Tax=Luteolibacter sp. TaxID=1962973 RepID=UPI003263635C
MFVINPISYPTSSPPRLLQILIPIVSAAIAFSVQRVNAALTPPSNLTLSLAWNAVPEANIQGYRVYVGTASNQYSRQYNTGNVTTIPVGELLSGQTYYFAVKAISSTGIEGQPSDELVVPVTSRPQALNDSYSITGDTRLAVPANGVLANDTDLDSSSLTAVLDSAPSHGSLSLDSNGGFAYTPYAGFSGIDSFVYHANDGVYDSAAAIVDVSVKKPTFQLLSNGSFESNYSGWITTGNQSIETASPYVATDGGKLVVFNSRDLAPGGMISQSFPTVVGETYTLKFDSGIIAYNTSMQRLMVNVVGGINQLSQTLTFYGTGAGANRWQSYTYTFVADTTTTTLSFRDDSPVSGSIDLLLDNVSVTGPKKSDAIPIVAESANTPSLAGRPGAMTVGMTVVKTGSYVLERSTDLIHWEVLDTTVVTTPVHIELMDTLPVSGNQPKMFYRIGRQ